MLIHHFLEKSAALFPDKLAVICDDARCSYAGLNGMANSLADWLHGQGLQAGDRVAVLLNNGLEFVVSYFGALKAGGVAVPLNSELKPDGLRRILQKLGAAVLITTGRFERLVEAAGTDSLGIHTLLIIDASRSWGDVPFSVYSWKDATTDSTTVNTGFPQADTDLASIIFTSGSMGQPKGVMLSHSNIVANTCSIIHYLQLTAADRQMVVLPFHYVMGMSLLTTHIAVGGSLVINNRFAFPADVLQQMEREAVTSFSGVPSTYAYLLHRSPLRAYRERLGTLRYCSQAGGHLSWQIKQQLLDTLPAHTRLYVMYGATEAAARLSFVEPERLLEKLDSIGRPIPGVSMRVLDDQGCEVPKGQVGELVAEGANIMLGYWHEPATSAVVLDRHGYHTGDLGYCDTDGYFFIVGRKDHQVKVGGHRIDPQEIEDALMATGMLLEVAVLGVPDAMLGTRLVVAAVPIHTDTTAHDLLARCADCLPRYKLPTEVKIVADLPKISSGKLDAARCRELFGCETAVTIDAVYS